MDIANTFQIWSMLAGYEELAKTFEPVRNGETKRRRTFHLPDLTEYDLPDLTDYD